jgi:2'-5' RNA ligase
LAEILAEHAAFAAGPAEIREIALMKSTLRPEGPIYETMARLPFGGAADRPSPTGD